MKILSLKTKCLIKVYSEKIKIPNQIFQDIIFSVHYESSIYIQRFWKKRKIRYFEQIFQYKDHKFLLSNGIEKYHIYTNWEQQRFSHIIDVNSYSDLIEYIDNIIKKKKLLPSSISIVIDYNSDILSNGGSVKDFIRSFIKNKYCDILNEKINNILSRNSS